MKPLIIILALCGCAMPPKDPCLPRQMSFSPLQDSCYICPAGHTHRVTSTYSLRGNKIRFIHNLPARRSFSKGGENKKQETKN